MSDYAALALAASPFVLTPLGIVLMLNGHVWALGFLTYSLVCGWSCGRLLVDMINHGIHNDR